MIKKYNLNKNYNYRWYTFRQLLQGFYPVIRILHFYPVHILQLNSSMLCVYITYITCCVKLPGILISSVGATNLFLSVSSLKSQEKLFQTIGGANKGCSNKILSVSAGMKKSRPLRRL